MQKSKDFIDIENRKGRILLIMLVILTIIFGSGFVFAQQPYKSSVVIDNTNNPNNLINYTVLLTVNTNLLISEGKMRSDCGDVRFYDSDDTTSLPYWIEPNTCNTTETKIFIKIPEIPASSTKTIYMEYGNLSLTSESNASAAFLHDIPRLVASWHFDEGSGTNFYDSSGNGNTGYIVTSSGWWNGNYLYRKKVVITNNNDTNLTAGHPINITIDTASLISQGKMLPNGNDLRVVYAGTEINRTNTTAFNSTSTVIWFNAQATIANGSSDTYYIYYGNPNAGNPQTGGIDTTQDYSLSQSIGAEDQIRALWTDGKFGKALKYDGVNDWAYTPNSASLVSPTTEMSGVVWLKLDTLNKFHKVMDKDIWGAGFVMRIENNNRFMTKFYWSDGTATVELESPTVPDTGWHHMVFTFNSSSGNITHYLDAYNIVTWTGYAGKEIKWGGGSFKFSYGNWLNGIMDEVMIFNKTLTAEEVADLYEGYAYTTTNYAGHALVRKFSDPEPIAALLNVYAISPEDGERIYDTSVTLTCKAESDTNYISKIEVYVYNSDGEEIFNDTAIPTNNTLNFTYDFTFNVPYYDTFTYKCVGYTGQAYSFDKKSFKVFQTTSTTTQTQDYSDIIAGILILIATIAIFLFFSFNLGDEHEGLKFFLFLFIFFFVIVLSYLGYHILANEGMQNFAGLYSNSIWIAIFIIAYFIIYFIYRTVLNIKTKYIQKW